MGCGNAGHDDIFDQQPDKPSIQDASPDSPSFRHPILHLKLPSFNLSDASPNVCPIPNVNLCINNLFVVCVNSVWMNTDNYCENFQRQLDDGSILPSDNNGCYYQQSSGSNCLPILAEHNQLSGTYYCCPALDAATIPLNDWDADEGSDDGSSNDAGMDVEMKTKLDVGMKTENDVENDAATEEASSPIVASEASLDDSGDENETSTNSDAGTIEASISDDGSFDDSSRCYISDHNGTNCQPIENSCQFYCCPVVKPCH